MDFTPAEVNFANWDVVNDGVMGGLSNGKLRFENRILYFSGELSLANNGGFSLIRTETYNLNLSEFDGISIRVKGDGREYQMRLNTDASFRSMPVAFSAKFKTVKDEWSEIKIPFELFSGSFRGIPLSQEKLDPAKISRLGILLGDKKAGTFYLQIDWIRSYTAK